MDVMLREPSLEVIFGCMFSGKSEELESRLRAADIAELNVLSFIPGLDNRYEPGAIVSHSGLRREAIIIDKPEEIYRVLMDLTDVVGIDEGQFLGPTLVDVAHDLVKRGKIVKIAALNTDFRGQPWPYDDGTNIGRLIALANYHTSKTALCKYRVNGKPCAQTATRTQRLSEEGGTVVVGGEGIYEPRCMRHFIPGK